MRKVTEDFIGTCQACFGEFKVNGDKLVVLHGYQRPGDGYIIGHCPGTEHAPFEYDTTLTVQIIGAHRVRVIEMQQRLEALNTGKITSLVREFDRYDQVTRRHIPMQEIVTPGHEQWKNTLTWEVRKAERDITHHTHVADFLQGKVDTWTRQQIIGIDSPATGKERALRKAYDPVEAAAAEGRAAEKAARDAKPGKLKVTFYRQLEWVSNDATQQERCAFFEKEEAETQAWLGRLKAWAKANFEGKIMVRETYDSDLPRSVRDRTQHYKVAAAHLPWEYRDQIKSLLAVAEQQIDKKKVDYFVEGEP